MARLVSFEAVLEPIVRAVLCTPTAKRQRGRVAGGTLCEVIASQGTSSSVVKLEESGVSYIAASAFKTGFVNLARERDVLCSPPD